MPTTMVDSRCFADGAYCVRGRELFRCLGERHPKPADRPARIGFENAVDPREVRWVRPSSLFAQRLEFVKQGDPTTDRETIEAMPA
jgi:hypothetical protein